MTARHYRAACAVAAALIVATPGCYFDRFDPSIVQFRANEMNVLAAARAINAKGGAV